MKVVEALLCLACMTVGGLFAFKGDVALTVFFTGMAIHFGKKFP